MLLTPPPGFGPYAKGLEPRLEERALLLHPFGVEVNVVAKVAVLTHAVGDEIGRLIREKRKAKG